MKIAFLSAYSGPVKRGIESWVNELGSRLAKNNEVVVYQLGEHSGEPYTAKTINIPVDWNEKDMTGTPERAHDVDYWSAMLGRFTLKLLPDLMKFQPDIVFPLNGSWELPICRKYCDYSGAKVVLVGHCEMQKEFAHKPDLFIATTERQANTAKDLFEGPIKIIPNAVDINCFTKEGETYQLDVPSPRILTVGALVEDKKIKQIITAVSKLTDISLVICGDGDLRDEIKEMGKELLGDRFQLVQFDHAEMPALYRACDLFTLVPETTEAFGIVYLEAIATGLGVVALDDQARRDIISDAGFFVEDPDNTESYSRVLDKALQTNFGNKPRLQAEKFSWEKIAEKYEDVLSEITKESSSKTSN